MKSNSYSNMIENHYHNPSRMNPDKQYSERISDPRTRRKWGRWRPATSNPIVIVSSVILATIIIINAVAVNLVECHNERESERVAVVTNHQQSENQLKSSLNESLAKFLQATDQRQIARSQIATDAQQSFAINQVSSCMILDFIIISFRLVFVVTRSVHVSTCVHTSSNRFTSHCAALTR